MIPQWSKGKENKKLFLRQKDAEDGLLTSGSALSLYMATIIVPQLKETKILVQGMTHK